MLLKASSKASLNLLAVERHALRRLPRPFALLLLSARTIGRPSAATPAASPQIKIIERQKQHIKIEIPNLKCEQSVKNRFEGSI